MKKERIERVKTEMRRLTAAIKELEDTKQYSSQPRETGAVRRASMDLTRALAVLRRSDYDNG